MTTETPRRAATWFLFAALSCGAGRAERAADRLTAGRSLPPDIERACKLAGQRCTRCHTIDRVLLAHIQSPDHWRFYVERMRRQQESGITPEDGEVIVRCLIYRSFGPAGLTPPAREDRRPDEE